MQELLSPSWMTEVWCAVVRRQRLLCPSSLRVFDRFPPAFALELAILCALLGLRLAVLGCTRGRGGRSRARCRVHPRVVSSPVPFPVPSPNPNPSPTPLFLSPLLCCAEAYRPTERSVVRWSGSSSSVSLAPSSS